jgi:hypothetical protein
MSTPLDNKQPNGARLAAIMDGLRRATPLPTQGRDGSSRRTARGYTLPRSGTARVTYPPAHWYESGGTLHCTPFYVNGVAPTVQGVPLDDWTPPALALLEDMQQQRHWFVLQITFGTPRIETLGWPEYDDGDFSAPARHIPFQAIVPGTPIAALEILTLTSNPFPDPNGPTIDQLRRSPLVYWSGIAPNGQSLADMRFWDGFRELYGYTDLMGQKAPGESDPADYTTPFLGTPSWGIIVA